MKTQDQLQSDFNIAIPTAIEVEQAILGAILIENTAQNEVIGKLAPTLFFDNKLRSIFVAIQTLYSTGEKIDIYTVANQLKINNVLGVVGGVNALVDLTSKVASGAHTDNHVRILIEKNAARTLQLLGQKLVSLANSSDVDELIGETTRTLDEVSTLGLSQSAMQSISDTLKLAVTDAEHRTVGFRNGTTQGITSGIGALDAKINGWQKGELTIIAGRPAMGKTAVSLHFARAAAASGRTVLFFSLEMTNVKLTDRMLMSECRNIRYEDYRRGNLDDLQWLEINRAQDALDKLPLFINTNPYVTMRHIKAHSGVMARRGKCDLIIIDYLQLVSTDGGQNRGRNREQEVASISKEAKLLAKSLNVPVILLSQLNRSVEKREDGKPQLSDLRDSGSIEQDADAVMFVYRPEYYNIPEANDLPTEGMGFLLVEKLREGPTGNVIFGYNSSLTKIGDYAQMRDERAAAVQTTPKEDLPF